MVKPVLGVHKQSVLSMDTENSLYSLLLSCFQNLLGFTKSGSYLLNMPDGVLVTVKKNDDVVGLRSTLT